MAKPLGDYDVYYRLKTPAVFVVKAHNTQNAAEEGLRQLESMSRGEFIDHFLAAIEFNPAFEIVHTKRTDKSAPAGFPQSPLFGRDDYD